MLRAVAGSTAALETLALRSRGATVRMIGPAHDIARVMAPNLMDARRRDEVARAEGYRRRDWSSREPITAPTARSKTMIAVRYGLPAVIVLAGMLALIFSDTLTGLEGLAMGIGVAASVLLLNVLYRVGVKRRPRARRRGGRARLLRRARPLARRQLRPGESTI